MLYTFVFSQSMNYVSGFLGRRAIKEEDCVQIPAIRLMI